jgi:hypothetical protein
MTALTRFLYPLPAHRSLGRIVAWWEQRRLAFNLVVGATGLVSYSVVALIGVMPPFAHPGGPPLLAIVAYGVLANLCYTLGWFIEGGTHLAWRDEVRPTGPVLFRQGLIFSIGVTCLPMAVAMIDWGIRFLRFIW